MTGPEVLSNIIQFPCPACGAQLSVAAELAGIVGPCPGCYEQIQAPMPQVASRSLERLAPVFRVPQTNPGLPAEARAVFPPWVPEAQAFAYQMATPREKHDGSSITQEQNFKARLAIPPQEDELDESWKKRHRNQARQRRIARKAEDTAQKFLESRIFHKGRGVLIVITGALLTWLYIYLQDHHWRLPGMSPAVAEDKMRKSSNTSPSAAGKDLDKQLGDDDTEIPPASNQPPAVPDPARRAPPALTGNRQNP